MAPHPGPTRALERVIALLMGNGDATDYVIGDLREEYRAVRARRSAVVSTAWYLAQGLAIVARVRVARLARSGAGAFGWTGLTQSWRFLRRRPAFSGTVVATVALAIASTTVAFAIVDGVLLEPLPYAEPDRLVAIWERNPQGEDRNVVSPANVLRWRESLRSLDAVASVLESSTTLTDEGQPERVGFLQISASYFEMVGAEPVVGRLYTVEEDDIGGPAVVVLSEGFWRRRFAADPSVVGRTLRLGPIGTYTVVGVLDDRYDFDPRRSFGGIGSRDVWMPPRFPASAAEVATGRYLQALGRLAPGETVETAQREASALAARLSEAYPDSQRDWDVNVVPLQEDLVGDARATILAIFGAVCLVLLIACANVANLILTRAEERKQEMAIRSALGAGRGRLAGQLLVESTLLSAAGGVAGVLLADRVVTALVASAPDIPRIEEVGVDATVLGFALLATVGTAVLFGLAPALSLGRSRQPRFAGRGATGDPASQRLRGALVVAQVSLSLVLLVGAGLLVRSLVNRLTVPLGFDVAGVLTTDVQLGGWETEEQARFFEQLVARVDELPGVGDASAITFPPLAGGGTRTDFWPLDRPAPEPGLAPGADVRWVHRDYHRTLRIPLLAGRMLGPGDDAEAPTVVLVNQTGADLTWPGENPLGKRVALPWTDTIVAEVVGVVGDVRHEGPETEPFPMLYYDHRQFSGYNIMSLVVRTRDADQAGVVSSIRATLGELAPSIPLYNVRSMEALLADTTKRARLATVSLGAFALLALLLAAVGIYGVVASVTQRRTREIGIRMALGAGRPGILGMVVRQGMTRVAVAIALGTMGALALSRVLEGLVFDVSTTDPVTFAAMALLLAGTALLACWIPARRASAVDPARTMRTE